jgi:hypothetical protein
MFYLQRITWHDMEFTRAKVGKEMAKAGKLLPTPQIKTRFLQIEGQGANTQWFWASVVRVGRVGDPRAMLISIPLDQRLPHWRALSPISALVDRALRRESSLSKPSASSIDEA